MNRVVITGRLIARARSEAKDTARARVQVNVPPGLEPVVLTVRAFGETAHQLLALDAGVAVLVQGLLKHETVRSGSLADARLPVVDVTELRAHDDRPAAA